MFWPISVFPIKYWPVCCQQDNLAQCDANYGTQSEVLQKVFLTSGRSLKSHCGFSGLSPEPTGACKWLVPAKSISAMYLTSSKSTDWNEKLPFCLLNSYKLRPETVEMVQKINEIKMQQNQYFMFCLLNVITFNIKHEFLHFRHETHSTMV